MIPLEKLPYISWEDDSGHTVILRASVTEQESISLDSEVTDLPVETGSNITDHIRRKPITASATLFFTDALIRADLLDVRPEISKYKIKGFVPPPIGLSNFTGTGSIIGTISDLLAAKQEVTAYAYDPPDVPIYVSVYDKISDLRDAGTLVTVKTSIHLFEEMVIETCEFVRGPETGNGVRITLSLKKVRFVKSDITLAIPLPSVARAQPKKEALKPGAFDVPRAPVSTLVQGGSAAGFLSPVRSAVP